MDYIIEKSNDKNYINGVHFFEMVGKPLCVTAASHIHTAIEIIYVTAGSFTALVDGIEHKIFAGDLLLFKSNVIHHLISGTDNVNSYYVLKIKPDLILDISSAGYGAMYALAFALKHENSKYLWTASETEKLGIKESFMALKQERTNDGNYSDIGIKLAAGNIILTLMRSGAVDTLDNFENTPADIVNTIYKTMMYISQHYSEDLDAKKMSGYAAMSYSYFSRSFKKITGKTFKEYINQIRINRAERLLATTNKSITQISIECGFNNSAYFIKVFRNIKGKAPGIFRTQISNQ